MRDTEIRLSFIKKLIVIIEEYSMAISMDESILLYLAFCTIMAMYDNRRKPEAESMSYSYQMTSIVISAKFHREHCTLQVFEQF